MKDIHPTKWQHWIVNARNRASDLGTLRVKAPKKKATFQSPVLSGKNKILTRPVFHQALHILKNRDPDLGAVLSTFGPPPLWKRKPGFPTLLQIILEQQVSLSSARATFHRLLQTVPVLTPKNFLKLDGKILRQMGFSRQKAYYCTLLADSIRKGSLDLEGLKTMDDDQARTELIKITGIGKWTADIYLLTALRRPNIWPIGDLALTAAVQSVKGLETRPSSKELEELSLAWEPWRAVATRIFWHHYLSTQNEKSRRSLKLNQSIGVSSRGTGG